MTSKKRVPTKSKGKSPPPKPKPRPVVAVPTPHPVLPPPPVVEVLPIVKPGMTGDEIAREIALCYESVEYFICNYCKIPDESDGTLFLFELWPDQKKVLKTFISKKQVVVLKASCQIGVSCV